MSVVDIKICKVDDPPAFPELVEKVKMEADITHVAVLEKGMQSGRTSVGLMVHLGEDEYAVVQVSAAQLLQIAAAVRGAAQKFGETDL